MTRATIKNVRMDDERLTFEFDDSRQVSLPISMSPRLEAATPTQRSHWRIGANGMFVHWPDVDEDIAIWEILGLPEEAYLRVTGEAPVS
jgi:Protein of unknown function (DUF2442)